MAELCYLSGSVHTYISTFMTILFWSFLSNQVGSSLCDGQQGKYTYLSKYVFLYPIPSIHSPNCLSYIGPLSRTEHLDSNQGPFCYEATVLPTSYFISLRLLSHLVWMLCPNPSLIAPPSSCWMCSHYNFFITNWKLHFSHPRDSCLPLFLGTNNAGEDSFLYFGF